MITIGLQQLCPTVPQIFCPTVSGVQRAGDVRVQLLDCMSPPKLSITQECDKDRHLKYLKTSVEKKILKN